jgi:N6-L-threonylcarbamoyladenine synthase
MGLAHTTIPVVAGSTVTHLLAIESSCDETAAAVVRIADGALLSNVIRSQTSHAAFGGVVPELASREHLAAIVPCVREAMATAGLLSKDVVAVAATYGPGLMGGLQVGLQMAKGLSVGWGVPLIGVHHIEGHLMAASLDAAAPKPPFMGLVVSGGHSALYRFDGVGTARLIGDTRDDAAGEAFDKCAKLLGLGYPGGAVIDQLARDGDPTRHPLPHALRDRTHYDFSFSGLKTAVRTLVEGRVRAGLSLDGPFLHDVCAAVQAAIVDALLHKALLACRRQNVPTLVLGGGVAANSWLRSEAIRRGQEDGTEVYCPPRVLCTDNAAMIAAAALAWWRQGRHSSLALSAQPDALVSDSSNAHTSG